MRHDVIHGDCLEVLREMPAQSIDAVVTDPPYGLGEVKDLPGLLTAWMSDADDRRYTGRAGFMGKGWDRICPGPRYWREVYRVMKPGAHLLCFAGTRTWDLASLAIRLAGFENRDTISHEGALRFYHGQGFPKGLDIGKAIDRIAGIEREVVGRKARPDGSKPRDTQGGRVNTPFVARAAEGDAYETAPATEEAKKWDGWNAALKPAWEIILVFRRPLEQPGIAKNVLKWGCGGLNIGECRVGNSHNYTQAQWSQKNASTRTGTTYGKRRAIDPPLSPGGRYPPNLLFSHLPGCERIGTKKVKGSRIDKPCTSDEMKSGYHPGLNGHRPARGIGGADGTEEVEEYRCVDGCRVKALDEMSGTSKSISNKNSDGRTHARNQIYGEGKGWSERNPANSYDDKGGASRYFPQFHDSVEWGAFYTPKASKRERTANGTIANQHPCVKALSLVRWLVRLVGIPGGTILDPYAGSGTTGVACVYEGFDFVGIEAEEEYCEIGRARIAHAGRQVSERLPL